MDTLLVLDFGSQTTQLIARRIRELGVYSRIIPGDSDLGKEMDPEVRGIILSGSPASVYEDLSPCPDRKVYSLGLPVLGICYGIQRMIQDHGGEILSLEKKEYGRSRVSWKSRSPRLLEGMAPGFVSWMSHGDTINRLAPGFETVAFSDNGLPAVIEHKDKPFFGLQFHPEASHCEGGMKILENFAVRVCGARQEWNMERFLSMSRQRLRARVGEEPVLLLVSGGVDSSAVAALLLSSLAASQVHLMYIDTGLMRSGESEEVIKTLRLIGGEQIYAIDASARFLEALQGVSEPEAKRRIIGDLFIKVQQDEVERLGILNAFLAQGTLYTDLIESGKGVGKKADVIKSHHNVRSPLVEERRRQGRLLEPLSELYKDEVRTLGRRLGLPEEILKRHPFPGPGLAVRILGEVTRERCDLLRQADHIFLEELKRRNLYDRIWQAFCVLLPIRSVGVSGDVRRYGQVVALRAIASRDGMTADVFPFAMEDLLEIASLLTNRIPKVGRVVYDVSSKPPATIEWE